jgi:ribosomal protein L20
MLRSSPVALGWKPRRYIERVMPMLNDRAKLERKLAVRKVLGRIRHETNRRNFDDHFMNRSIVRVGVNAAAREHGTDFPKLQHDLARQDVPLFPTTLQTLAIYEPMAFRALCELSASGIHPPTPLSETKKTQLSALEQLNEDVSAIRSHKSPLADEGDLRHVWKRYVKQGE